MGVLRSLTFVAIHRSPKLSPEQQRRIKLVGHLQEQLGLAKAARDGSVFSVKKRRWRLTEDGGKEMAEVDKRLRPWWTVNQDGSLTLSLRWGRNLIEFQRGKAGIAVEGLEELIRTLQLLVRATEAGELDAYLGNNNSSMLRRKTRA